jgi:hypothetical protein
MRTWIRTERRTLLATPFWGNMAREQSSGGVSMKKLAVFTAIVALTAAVWAGGGANSTQAQEEELGNVFFINPSVCLALVPAASQTVCLPGFGGISGAVGGTLYVESNRGALASSVLDANGDDEVTREEVNRFVPFSGIQVHDEDGALILVAFVEDDNRVQFQTESGAFKVDDGDFRNNFICDQAPGTVPGGNMFGDEDCDGDGIRGDGIVFAHFYGNGEERGPGVIEVFDATNGEVIGDQPYEIVGEPEDVTAGPFETVLAAGLHPADCLLPTGASGFLDAFGTAEKTIIFGNVVDDDEKQITGAWITWSIEDPDILAVASPTSPTLDLGTFGVAAPNILCGLEPGTTTLTLTLDSGANLSGSILFLDPGAERETVEVEITVLPVADSATTTVTPASIACNGVNTAEVAVNVANVDGDPVVDGSVVEFDVVALGTTAPTTATTTDGIARTVVTPLSSDLAGVTVVATVYRGPTSFPTPYDEDGRDNDNDDDVDEDGELNIDGDEFDTGNRIPNTDFFQVSTIVGCTGGTVPPPPPPGGGGGTGTGGGGGSGGVITGPDTGSGGAAAGTGSLPIWSAVALFVGAMALVGARLAVRRVE